MKYLILAILLLFPLSTAAEDKRTKLDIYDECIKSTIPQGWSMSRTESFCSEYAKGGGVMTFQIYKTICMNGTELQGWSISRAEVFCSEYAEKECRRDKKCEKY
ncbi:MAG: hypothetical protein OXC97_05645 [Candidatus Dadabacteria bacterium]|nr:hypothetical protein [Candidatus Dadabacteria bacterium]